MNIQNVIIKTLATFHYSSVVNFFKDTIVKTSIDELKVYCEALSGSTVLSNIEIDFLINIYAKELDSEKKVYYLSLISEKDTVVFHDLFLRDTQFLKIDVSSLDVIIKHLKEKRVISFLIDQLKTEDLLTRGKLLQKLASFADNKVEEIIDDVLKNGNELEHLSIIKGINSKYFKKLTKKVFSSDPTMEIACLSRFSRLMMESDTSTTIRKTIISIINDKLSSDNEIVRIAAIKSISFYDKKLFSKLLEMWRIIHPFYFPVLRESVMNMIMLDRENSAISLIIEQISIFKVKNFVKYLNRVDNHEFLHFIFRNLTRTSEIEEFLLKIKPFMTDKKLFVDQRFVYSFFRDINQAEIDYFKGSLEAIFTRDYETQRFNEIDIKIIAEYLELFGMLGRKIPEHFRYVNYDYIKLAILKFMEKDEKNFTFFIESAKYKSDIVKEYAIYGLGEYENSIMFLRGLFNECHKRIRPVIIKAISLGISSGRYNFFIQVLDKYLEADDALIEELMDALMPYFKESGLVERLVNVISGNTSLKAKVKALKIMVVSGNIKEDYLMTFIDKYKDVFTREEIFEFLEVIKYLPRDRAIDFYFIVVDRWSAYTVHILKYLNYFKTQETAEKLIEIYNDLVL